MTTDVSPKVYGSAFGAALATIFWTIAAATFWEGTFTDTELAALVGSSSVLVAAIVGYLIPDKRRVNPTPTPLPVDPTLPPAVGGV